MPTVVDSFVVEMELDPRKFDSGRRQAEENFEKTKFAAVKTANEVEGQFKKTGETVGALNTNVLKLFAAFTGVGAAAFLKQMVSADAATGRAAKTLDMSTKDLGIWEGAAQLAGAKTGELTSGFTSLTQALETARLTGDASLGAKFRQLFQIDVIGPNGLKTAAELYLEVAEKARGMDPAKAATAMNLLGIPAGVIPLLLQGADAVEKLKAQVAALGPATDADAAAAVRLENAWTRAWKGIQGAARGIYPFLTDIGNAIAMAFSPKAIDLFAQRWKAVKAFFASSPAVYREEQDKFLKMQKEFLEWQSGAGGKAFVGEEEKPFRSQVGVPPVAAGAFTSQADKEAFIRAEAVRLKIDPAQAMRVAKSEGFTSFYGDKDALGNPTSFGAFQLHRPGVGRNTADGLGTAFTKQTGLDPSDPKNEAATITFALERAARAGWGDWHGWKGAPFAGISGGGAGLSAAGSSDNRRSSSSTTDVHIGTITVNTQATDAPGIAKDIGPAIKRDLFVQQSNNGPE